MDLLAFGETMIALAPPPGRTVRDAAALLVDHAGAESNTCVGLARLGHRVAWLSRLGTDAVGDRILAALAAEAIDTQWVERDARRPTGVMLKEPGAGVRYYRSESAASVMGPELLERVPIANARAVLVTGVTALIGPRPHAAAVALLDRARGLRIVDPNLRAGLWGSDRRAELVRPLVERCDLLLAGAAEAREILGWPATPASPAGAALAIADRVALARAAAAIGPREVVLRDASIVGALADGVWRAIDIRRNEVVDAIGAGDAFNAGYISARLRGQSIEDALRLAIACGTAVTRSVSDTAGFPRPPR
jgi:2-dehydro-3-deoxygluconokinase